LQRIFSARLVVIRDAGDLLGLAPAGIDPRNWLDALDSLHRVGEGMAPRSLPVPAGDAWPRASGIEQFVVIPLKQPHGSGSLWLGFTAPAPASELAGFAIVGDLVSYALWRLGWEATIHGKSESSEGHDLTVGEIVSIAAHELRTPLTPITMLLQSLERKARSGTIDIDAIVRTRRQVARLAQMISDFLDLTRLREGRLVLTPARIELGSCLTEAVARFRESDPRRRVELVTRGEPLHISTDVERIMLGVTSLLEHVARVTPAEGVMRVTLERRADRAAVRFVAGRPLTPPEVFPTLSGSPQKARPPAFAALGALVAQAVFARFGGAIVLSRPDESPAYVEATFPLSAPDAG
jgi:K+-sensing histidine kinase KdpD